MMSDLVGTRERPIRRGARREGSGTTRVRPRASRRARDRRRAIATRGRERRDDDDEEGDAARRRDGDARDGCSSSRRGTPRRTGAGRTEGSRLCPSLAARRRPWRRRGRSRTSSRAGARAGAEGCGLGVGARRPRARASDSVVSCPRTRRKRTQKCGRVWFSGRWQSGARGNFRARRSRSARRRVSS